MLNPSLSIVQATMRLSSVAGCHLCLGLNLKECFRIAWLNLAELESIGREEREARKGGIERHSLMISANETKAEVTTRPFCLLKHLFAWRPALE
jgi:hypothetical protein